MVQLPSYLQPEDWCKVNFGFAGNLIFARVTKVIFSRSKVLYDLEIPVNFDPEKRIIENGELLHEDGWTRIHSIDSAFIERLENNKTNGIEIR